MTRTRPIRVCLAATVVLVAACSSGDDAAPDGAATTASATTQPATSQPPATTTTTTTTAPPATTTTSTTTTTTTTTTTPVAVDPFATDKALANAALLSLDDFPEGWEAVPVDDEDDEDDPGYQEQFDECLGDDGDDSIGDQLEGREVVSPEFTPDGGTTSVTQEVLMADDEAMAIAAMEEVGVAGADVCMAGVMQAFFEDELANDPEFAADFPPGMTIGRITVERLESAVDPTIAVEYVVVIPLELDGDVLEVHLDVVYFRQGRALSQIQFQSVESPFDPEGIAFLGGTTLDRLAVIGT